MNEEDGLATPVATCDTPQNPVTGDWSSDGGGAGQGGQCGQSDHLCQLRDLLMEVRHEQTKNLRKLQSDLLLLEHLPAGALEQDPQEALQVPLR